MQTYQKYLAIILIALLFMSSYFYLQNKQDYVDKVQSVLINILNKQIEHEKLQAFNFAFALSQNETLKDSLKNNDSAKGYTILKEHMYALEVFSNSKINAQIVKEDFTIFARSWDNRDAGLNVKQYRPDLQEILKNRTSHLSFEAARKLVLIASIPIINNDKIIGFMEVITRFNSLKDNLANYDMDLLVLLDSKYETQAVLLKKNPKIENMIVANDGANVEHIANLQNTGISKLLQEGQLEDKNYFYFLKPILNNSGDKLGFFVLIVSKNKLALFSAFESELDSLFTYARKDLYYSIIKNSEEIDSFTAENDKDYTKEKTNISRGNIK